MEKLDRLYQDFGELLSTASETALSKISTIPGSAIVLRYIKSSYQNDPIRSFLEALLVLFAIRYFLASKYSTNKKNFVKLEDYEIDDLVDEWEPEPLVFPVTESEALTLKSTPVIKGPNGFKVHLTTEDEVLNSSDLLNASLLKTIPTISEDDPVYLNFSNTDIFYIGGRPFAREEASKIIHAYGVGSCGPAGFYGNQDAHIQCEKDISKFIGTEKTILYSQYFATPSSVIPCFFKRGDYIIADSNVNITIQKGIVLSRAHIYWFKHNDMEDLEAKVIQATKAHRKGPIPRRVIITEGIFENSGDSPDLKKIVEIRNKYKFRILLDESWSLGVLGKTGRGLPEQCGVDRKDIDFTIGSLVNGFGSAGGFCAGPRQMVDYQQITSLAYTFSATMPPYLAHNTSVAITKFLDTEEYRTTELPKLKREIQAFHDELSKTSFSKYARVVSRPDSALIIMRLLSDRIPNFSTESVDEKGVVSFTKTKSKKLALVEDDNHSLLLQKIVDKARSKGIIIARVQTLGNVAKSQVEQGLRLILSTGFTEDEVRRGARVVSEAIQEVIN